MDKLKKKDSFEINNDNFIVAGEYDEELNFKI